MVGKSFSMLMTHLIFIIERVDLQNSKLIEGLTTLAEKEGGCNNSRRHRDRAERTITTSLLQLKGPGIVKMLLDYAYKSLKVGAPPTCRARAYLMKGHDGGVWSLFLKTRSRGRRLMKDISPFIPFESSLFV